MLLTVPPKRSGSDLLTTRTGNLSNVPIALLAGAVRLHQVNGYLVGVTRFSASIDQAPKDVAVVAVGSIPTLAAWNEIQRGSYVRQRVFGEFPPFGGGDFWAWAWMAPATVATLHSALQLNNAGRLH